MVESSQQLPSAPSRNNGGNSQVANGILEKLTGPGNKSAGPLPLWMVLRKNYETKIQRTS